MALQMTRSPEIAEEVTQEAFISIYKNIGRFQFQSAFTTWVYRIVMRRAADYFRKNKKHQGKLVSMFNQLPGQAPLDVEDPDENPYIKADQVERVKQIEDAIYSLKDRQRSILILRYINQLQYEEIAEILKCKVGTVKSRLNRAHSILEERLRALGIETLD